MAQAAEPPQPAASPLLAWPPLAAEPPQPAASPVLAWPPLAAEPPPPESPTAGSPQLAFAAESPRLWVADDSSDDSWGAEEMEWEPSPPAAQQLLVEPLWGLQSLQSLQDLHSCVWGVAHGSLESESEDMDSDWDADDLEYMECDN